MRYIKEIVKLTEVVVPVLLIQTSAASELLSKMLKRRKNRPQRIKCKKLHQKEADIVAQAGRSGTVTIANYGGSALISFSTESKEAGGLANR